MTPSIFMTTLGICLMQVPPCLTQLSNELPTTRAISTNGMTHTTGMWMSTIGNVVTVNYEDNRNTFTDQFVASGSVSMTNNAEVPRTLRYRYRGASAPRINGVAGTPTIITPTTQEDWYTLDVCMDDKDGVVMSIVGENIPPETTKNIDFSIIVTFDEPVNQWDRNDDGVVDTYDLAMLMGINGVDVEGVNICISLMDFTPPPVIEEPEEPEEPEPPTTSEYPREIRLTLNALPNDDTRANHWVIPIEDITSEVIAGDLDVSSDTGGGGPAALVIQSYGYTSVNVAPIGEQTTDEWVIANPDQQWKIEIVRDGIVIDTINSEIIQNPDATPHYGDGVWWRTSMTPDQYQIGDQWIVYGY
jgi:hypothetical protein